MWVGRMKKKAKASAEMGRMMKDAGGWNKAVLKKMSQHAAGKTPLAGQNPPPVVTSKSPT